MKRSDALTPLSREHHVALEIALQLRRADADSSAKAREDFLTFFRDEAAAHFRTEEDVLLPAVADALPAQDPDVARVLTEHAEIRRRAAQLETGAAASDADLRALGDLLHDHVRHEERVLFPRVEAALSPEGLARLAAALRTAGGDHSPPRV